jgi:hypothetical protein
VLAAELRHRLPLGRRGDDVAPAQAQLSDESMCRLPGCGALAGVIAAEHAEQLA